MNKAVLILDKQPTCCKQCPLISSVLSPIDNKWYETCHITQKRLLDIEKIDRICPLLTNMRSEE